MVTNKPKRECSFCPTILGTLRKDKNKKCHEDPKTLRLHKDLNFSIIAFVKSFPSVGTSRALVSWWQK